MEAGSCNPRRLIASSSLRDAYLRGQGAVVFLHGSTPSLHSLLGLMTNYPYSGFGISLRFSNRSVSYLSFFSSDRPTSQPSSTHFTSFPWDPIALCTASTGYGESSTRTTGSQMLYLSSSVSFKRPSTLTSFGSITRDKGSSSDMAASSMLMTSGEVGSLTASSVTSTLRTIKKMRRVPQL